MISTTCGVSATIGGGADTFGSGRRKNTAARIKRHSYSVCCNFVMLIRYRLVIDNTAQKAVPIVWRVRSKMSRSSPQSTSFASKGSRDILYLISILVFSVMIP